MGKITHKYNTLREYNHEQNYFYSGGFLPLQKKLTLIILSLILFLTVGDLAECAETPPSASDQVERIQKEISADIAQLRVSVENELSSISLNTADIDTRIQQLAELAATASDDMASWGYTPEQRELHTSVLAKLSIAYSTYKSLIDSVSQLTTSEDVASLGSINSPDINDSYVLRQKILKLSRSLDIQIFYLQSKLNKLRLDLNEAVTLHKQLKEAEDGGQALELPRTHMLELENARINTALSRLQVRKEKDTFDKNITSMRRLRRQLADMEGKLSFPESVLDDHVKQLQARLTELADEMKAARRSLDSANSLLRRTRNSLQPSDKNNLTDASSLVTARTSRVNYWEYMVYLLNDEIDTTRESQEVWRNRYKLFHNQATGEEIWTLRENSSHRIQELQRLLEGVRNLASLIIRDINEKNALASQPEISDKVKQNLAQAVEYDRRFIYDGINRYETFLPQTIFLWQRLLIEANENLTALRLAEKVSSFSKETIMNFLHTELWQGEGYSITVSKLVIAVLVFLSSFFLSSWGSNWIKRRIIKRQKTSISAANAVQRIVFYILWLVFLLIALNIVNIPLTAFAFAGGTITVAIAFGMQNIFNNLISGFIIIFSRPFKVNDIVDVAGIQGVVNDIGSRSTTIKTWDGFDVIMPNKYFLENNVINWTGTDLKKREVLKVSVSYDSDTRQVEKLLLEIVNSHSQILSNPAPLIIFKNFGDDGLEFEVYYWIELRKSSGMKVSSDMRHHIAAVFKREGIEIPYPQRVIHISKDDSQQPHGQSCEL